MGAATRGARRGLSPRLPQLIFVLAVLAAWGLATATGRVNRLILPPLPDVLRGLGAVLADPATYHVHLAATLGEFGVALATSVVAGLALGFLIGSRRYAADVFEPLLVALFAVPIITIFPLCILYFGIGAASKIVFATVYGFFPVAISTINAVRNVDRRLVDAARTMGAAQLDMALKVVLPSVLPFLMAGIRQAIAMEFLGVIAGETLSGVSGIGTQIASDAETFQAGQMYAWIVIAIALAALLNLLASRLERAVRPR